MDEISIGVLFLTLFALFLLSAFFSGSETALIALNRYRLRHLVRSGHRGARRAQQLLGRPDRLIGLILLGNNFVNILITQLATYIGFRLYGQVGIAIATGALTLLILIFAEVAPKTVAAIHSERIAFPAAFVYVPLLTLAYPLVWLVNLMANAVLRLLGIAGEESGSQALSREELRTVVSEAGSMIPRKHQKMLVSILDLEKAIVEDIMVPRNEIVGIDLEDDWDDILEELTGGQFSRIPAYRGGIDNIVGMLHIRKILPLMLNHELTHDALQGALKEAYFIPEGTSLNRQLLNFQREKQRIGLVVDEYGDIQGLVTLEDLLEEIVGEFTTEPAAFSKDIHPQQDGAYVIDGSTHVREVNRTLGWDLHTDGPRTINGLILEHMEFIPEPGTSTLIDGYPIEVVQTKNNAVKTVRIKPKLAAYKPGDSHRI